MMIFLFRVGQDAFTSLQLTAPQAALTSVLGNIISSSPHHPEMKTSTPHNSECSIKPTLSATVPTISDKMCCAPFLQIDLTTSPALFQLL